MPRGSPEGTGTVRPRGHATSYNPRRALYLIANHKSGAFSSSHSAAKLVRGVAEESEGISSASLTSPYYLKPLPSRLS